MNERKRVLIISSRPPEHYAGIGDNIIKGLEIIGYKVDYLTIYQNRDPHVIGLFPPERGYFRERLHLLKLKFPSLKKTERIGRLFFKERKKKISYISKGGRFLASKNEDEPPISIQLVLSKIEPVYDFVYVHCWQDMITSKTLKAVYDKLQVPIIITTYDFQPITGGCSYFGDCKNYQSNCGRCPILSSEDERDQTRSNFLRKKEVYSSIQCGLSCNKYTYEIALKSNIFPKDLMFLPSVGLMNETLFHPLDIKKSRKALGIPTEKKFVIFSRFTGVKHVTKGYDYLLDAVNLFAQDLSYSDKSKVLLLFAGSVRDESFESKFNIDVMHVGLLNQERLIKAYSAATFFISPSIEDAGPSMVNQCILCGTPVVAFNIGSALTWVENGVTGYRAPLKDTPKLAECIMNMFNLSDEDYKEMKINCRNFALKKVSLKGGAEGIVKRYHQIRNHFNGNN